MLIYSYFALKTSYRAPIKFRQNCNDVFCRKMWQNIGCMEKLKSGTGAGNANGNGNGTWTWARTRTKEIKLGDVSVLRVSLTIIARSWLFISTLYLFIAIIFFTVAFLAYGRTAQNFCSRISYTHECCNLGSWLTWVLLLPLPPFPHNGWNTEPF